MSIIDTLNHPSHLRHFVVETRTFQIEKARDVEMYGHLRDYIRRQNEKKKQEMEMSAELKRAKREKELKHKQDKLTLGEIKEKISRHESKLSDLKNEKHRLFAKFKQVLNDDENKKTIQRQKEQAAMNITFGPPGVVATSTNFNQSRTSNVPTAPIYSNITSTPSQSSQQQQQQQLNIHNSNNLPPIMHHQSLPGQPIYYPAPQHSNNVVSSAPTNTQSSSINHRLNLGRVPTPTSSFAGHKPAQAPQPIYSKSMPQIPMPTMSISPSMQSNPSYQQQMQNDRHRMSYKRSHEQVPMNLQGPGVPEQYLANYKQQLQQQQQQQSMVPPGYSPQQLAGQHVLPPHPSMDPFKSQQIFQSLLNSYAMGAPNPMYMNNPNSK